MDGSGGTIHFDAVDEDPVTIACDCGIELQSLVVAGQSQRLALDAHVAAPHGLAAHFAVRGCNRGLAGEAKLSFQMAFRLGHRREGIHPLNYFDHAFLALALLAAGCWHVDAEQFGVIEQRQSGLRLDRLPVDGELDGHTLQFLHSLCFKFGLESICNLLRGAVALLFLAPLPLSQVVIGTLQSAPGGEDVHLRHESAIEHHGHVVRFILGLDLGGDFLPVKDLVDCHGCLTLVVTPTPQAA